MLSAIPSVSCFSKNSFASSAFPLSVAIVLPLLSTDKPQTSNTSKRVKKDADSNNSDEDREEDRRIHNAMAECLQARTELLRHCVGSEDSCIGRDKEEVDVQQNGY